MGLLIRKGHHFMLLIFSCGKHGRQRVTWCILFQLINLDGPAEYSTGAFASCISCTGSRALHHHCHGDQRDILHDFGGHEDNTLAVFIFSAFFSSRFLFLSSFSFNFLSRSSSCCFFLQLFGRLSGADDWSTLSSFLFL